MRYAMRLTYALIRGLPIIGPALGITADTALVTADNTTHTADEY